MAGQGEEPQAPQTTTNIYNDLIGIKPPNFNWEAVDLPKEFRSFRRYCELMLSTPTYATKSDKSIVNYILLWMGPQAVEIFDNLPNLTQSQKENPQQVWNAFVSYFEPKSNFRLARFQLREMKQAPSEAIDSFMTRLKVQAQKCHFADTTALEDNLIDQMIKGVTHSKVRTQLLDYDPHKLNLDKCLDYARTYEATQAQLQQLDKKETVNYIKKQPKTSYQQQQQKSSAYGKQEQTVSNNCMNCGGPRHKSLSQCPASGQQCNKCKKMNHWAKVCLSSRSRNRTRDIQSPTQKQYKRPPSRNNQKQGHFKVHTVSHDEDTDDYEEEVSRDFETLTFGNITLSVDSHHTNNNPEEQLEAITTVRIEPHPGRQTNLSGKADTGAMGNILPLRIFKKLYPKHIDQKGAPTNTVKTDVKLMAYNNTSIPQYGTIKFPCKHKDSNWIDTTFHVADTENPVIFGLPTCQSLGMVILNCTVSSTKKPESIRAALPPIKTIEDLKEVYPNQFKGLGTFPGEHKLMLDNTVPPVIHAPRRAPIQLRDKIKAELDRMRGPEVIRPVTEPTDWVSSITYVQKPDGSLRLCLDPKDINTALKRGQHHTPTVEELSHRFSEAKVFSKLDAKSGYWSVRLDPKSQLLTTFNSPFGRFCFQRLPFGLKTSQDVFQRAMDDMLLGLPGIVSITDDITVYGKDEAEHDQNLLKLMERAKQKGLVFNPKKCFIKQTEVPFFGNIYSATGVRPDPAKVQAITELTPPTNKTELQSFLGMITYLSAYIPNLSEKTTPLRQLIQKDSHYQWNHEQQAAFNNLKSVIQTAGTLTYFDPNKPAILQVDASQHSLGAVLTQDNKPICYASKSLTETEKRYANIERELLACVFAAERFHTYISGGRFTIESDHRPLEMISKKNLAAAPARLQSMLLRLQRYDYQICYRPGKEMVLADSLSRLPKESKQDPGINLDVKVHFIQFSNARLQELREATTTDEDLILLTKYILEGFPERQNSIHPSTRKYWSFCDELSIEQGIILKGEQIMIPKSLQKTYLTQIHEGHQGIIRCQQRARNSIYWPGINKDIEDIVSTCDLCQKYQNSQKKEPLEPIQHPSVPWHTLGTDLLYYNNETFIIIGDYYSKYLLVEKLCQDANSSTSVKYFKKIFSLFGYPNTIISDNGPQFIGHAFQEFIKKSGITHITSSPHYPKSHGFIERMVQTVKNMMKKSPNLDSALLTYRTTPIGAQQPSPGQLLFGRKLQDNLPVYIKVTDTENNHETKDISNSTVKSRYDQQAKDLEELNIGQNIFYQDVTKKTWSPAIITGIGPEPRSYTIKCLHTGRFLRRNRIHIRPRDVTFKTENLQDLSQKFTLTDHSNQEPELSNRSRPLNTIVSPDKPSTPKKSALKTPKPIVTISDEDSHQFSPKAKHDIHEADKSPDKPRTTRSGRTIRNPQRLLTQMDFINLCKT